MTGIQFNSQPALPLVLSKNSQDAPEVHTASTKLIKDSLALISVALPCGMAPFVPAKVLGLANPSCGIQRFGQRRLWSAPQDQSQPLWPMVV
jgi:hypothetical protein